jgi:hypothetical protein
MMRVVIGPGLPVSDNAAIGFDHRNDFRSSSGEEAFVGHENIVPRESASVTLTRARRNIEHDRSRDSAQRSGRDRRREDLAVLDDEDVVGRAFGDVACVVQHQRFISAGQVRFDPRHDVVQIVQAI